MACQWAPQEIEILKTNYSRISAKDMEELLPLRKKASIHKKAEQLGLRGYIKSEWSQEDTVSLIENYKVYTVDEMVSRRLCSGRSKTAIKKKILTLGLEKRNRWSKGEEQILINNYLKKPVAEIKDLIPDKDYWTITSHARGLGLKKDPSSYRLRYDYNRLFFNRPDILNSYFAGFIAADGSVDEARSVVRLSLHVKDIDVLLILSALTSFTGNVESKSIKGGYGHIIMSKLEFSSAQQMVRDLKDNFNIVQNKTLILEPPTKLNYENSLAFIVGLIDGDGSIILPSKPDKWGHIYPIVNITGTQSLLEWAKQIFDKICPSMYGINAKVHPIKGSRAFIYKVGGKRAYRILKELQKVKTPTRLARKWDKIKEYEKLVGITT
jgi:hypothetical protein